MLAVLGTLLTIAVSIGISSLIDDIKTKQEEAKKEANFTLSSAELYNLVSRITNAARNKSSAAYDNVINQLDNIPNLYSLSPNTRSLVINAKRELQNKSIQAKQSLDNVERTAQGLENQILAFANEPEHYKASASGNQTISRITNEAGNLLKEVEKDV